MAPLELGIMLATAFAAATGMYENVIVGAVVYPYLVAVNVLLIDMKLIAVTEPNELMVAYAIAVFGSPEITT